MLAPPEPRRAPLDPERASGTATPDAEATKEEGLEESPLVGRMLSGKWRVDRLIGKGGVASVYEATHRNGRRAAIKALSPEFSGNRRMRGRFQREGYLANRVGHRGAVEVLDDDVSGDVAYLVMELLDGMTLDALRVARGGWLPASEVAWTGAALLDVLSAAHARGILHRDVKPGNVFVTREGELKLLDFGIASLRESEGAPGITETGVVLGTPGFMAPEQARGRSDEIGPTTDVYAVGATLFRLLSGRLVHEGATSGELQIAVATKDAPPLASVAPEVPRELARVVDRALQRDAARRFQTASAMKQALVEAAAAEGVRPTPPALGADPVTSVSPSERAPARGRRAARTTAAVLGGAALIGIVVYLSRRTEPSASAEPTGAVSAAASPSPPVTPPVDAPLSATASAPPPPSAVAAPATASTPAPGSPVPKRAPKPIAAPRAKSSPSAAPSAKPPLELLKQRL